MKINPTLLLEAELHRLTKEYNRLTKAMERSHDDDQIAKLRADRDEVVKQKKEIREQIAEHDNS